MKVTERFQFPNDLVHLVDSLGESGNVGAHRVRHRDGGRREQEWEEATV